MHAWLSCSFSDTEVDTLVNFADYPTRWRSRLLHVAQYASALPDSATYPGFFDAISVTSIRFRHEVKVVRVLLHASLFSRNGVILQDVQARAADLELLSFAIISGNRESGEILFGWR